MSDFDSSLFIIDVLLDPGHTGEAPGLPVPLESGSSKKKKGMLRVLGISNSCCHVGYRGTFRVEGYDNKADSSRAEDDIDVFGCRERSGASCNCNSAAGCNGRLKNDMKEKKRTTHQ